MDICSKCGRAKESQASASLTQWFNLCSCDFKAPPVEDQEKIELCKTCGKRKEAGRAGSFTQWIFRSDVCSCDDPASAEYASILASAPVPEHQLVTEEDEGAPELPVDGKDFPLERYKPLKVLGTGMSGSVYLCRDRLLGKRVAVKTLKQLSQSEMVAFQLEARANSKLQHPNIVTVLDFGATAGGSPFMVMDYVKGESLDSIRESRGTLDWQTTVRIMVELCDALTAAHENKILHRDLKPTNIMIGEIENESPGVCLLDFSVAQVDGKERQTKSPRALVGTPAYMSGDQAKGIAYSERSEIYSIGCIMFECLTGHLPFRGETALQTIQMHAEATPPAMAQVNPRAEIPASLQSIVDRCLKKKPDDRFASTFKLKIALQAVLREHGLKEVKPAVLVETMSTRLNLDQKYSWVKLMFIIVPALTVVIAVIAFFAWKPTPAHQDMQAKKVAAPVYVVPKKFEEAFTRLPNGEIKALTQLNDADLTVLLKEKDLTFLNLGTQPDITDDGAKIIAKLPMSSIFIERSAITDKGLKRLCKAKNLGALGLNHSQITDEGVKYLPLKLTTLGLDGAQIGVPGCKTISRLKELNSLTLSDTPINTECLKYIAKLPALQHLFANACSVNDEGLKAIKDMRTLRTLSVTNTDVTSAGILTLGGLPLTRLDVGICDNVDDRAVDFIARTWPDLQSLSINRTAITAKALKRTLPVFKNVTELRIGAQQYGDDDVQPVFELKKIGVLDLSYSNITEKTVEQFPKLPKLHQVVMHYCRKVPIKAMTDASKRYQVLSSDLKGAALSEDVSNLLDYPGAEN